jgi:hypothetical protein
MPVSRVGFVAANEVGDEADVDVAAGKHDASATCGVWFYLLSEECGEAYGSATFDKHFGVFHQKNDRVGD